MTIRPSASLHHNPAVSLLQRQQYMHADKMAHKHLIICILQTKWQNFATNLPGDGRHRVLVHNLRYTLSNARKGGRNGDPGEGCRKDSRESVRKHF